MSEKYTYWQMISSVYRRVSRETQEQFHPAAVSATIMDMLIEAMKADELCYTAVVQAPEKAPDGSMRIDFVIMSNESSAHLLVFPDKATADTMHMNYISCPTEYLLKTLMESPELNGLQIITNFNFEEHHFDAGELTRPLIKNALDEYERGKEIRSK